LFVTVELKYHYIYAACCFVANSTINYTFCKPCAEITKDFIILPVFYGRFCLK